MLVVVVTAPVVRVTATVVVVEITIGRIVMTGRRTDVVTATDVVVRIGVVGRVVAVGNVVVVVTAGRAGNVVTLRTCEVVVVLLRTRGVVVGVIRIVVVTATSVVEVVLVVEVVVVDVSTEPPPDPPLTPAIVTVTDFGDPVSVVWTLPAVSVIENDAAAVNVDTVAPPPAVADDVTFTVHTVDEVCTIESIDEMFVNEKSVPDVVDNVEHVTSSFPVTVKLIDTDDDVAADAANVTVGAVVSIVTVPDEAAERLSEESTAYAL